MRVDVTLLGVLLQADGQLIHEFTPAHDNVKRCQHTMLRSHR